MRVKLKSIFYIILCLITGSCLAPIGQEDNELKICPTVFKTSPEIVGSGDILTISGRNFENFEKSEYENNVFVNEIPATIHSLTDDELSIFIPEVIGDELFVEINIGTCDWALVIGKDSLIVNAQIPVINSIHPMEGPMGTLVTINGDHFRSDNISDYTVLINGEAIPQNNIQSVDDNQTIVFKVPEGASSGPVKVRLKGNENNENQHEFTYIFTADVSTLAGGGDPGYNEGNDITALFNEPSGIAVDNLGNVYVADKNNHVIRKITPSGSTSLFAGKPNTPGDDDDPVSGLIARFNKPNDITIDPSTNNMYVVEGSSRTIRFISPSGAHPVKTIAGLSGQANYIDNVIGSAARFRGPKSLIFASNGFIYVSDESEHLIRKINSDPSSQYFVSFLAGGGRFNSGNNDGAGSSAQFTSPIGITFDPSQNFLYVVGRNTHRVRRIDVNGLVTTIAGSTDGHSDDIGKMSKFNGPEGIVADGLGNLYIGDTQNHLIRKVSLESYSVTTLAGSLGDADFINGLGLNTKFNEPRGMAYDVKNNIIYVADSKNHAIRKIVLR